MPRNYVRVADREISDDKKLIRSLEKRNAKLINQMDQLARFIQSTGYAVRITEDAAHTSFSHGSIKVCKYCGAHPRIVEDIFDRGKWLVQCKCYMRTNSYALARDAIRAWNVQKLTEASEIMTRPLTKDGINTEGARQLVIALAKNAASDYRASVRAGKPSKTLETFFQGIYSGGRPVIEVLKKEATEDGEEVDEDEEQ